MNHTYKIDGVKHVYCTDCIPESQWQLDMIKAGRLTERALTTESCEACGDSGQGGWVVDPSHNWVRDETGMVVANCTGYDRDYGKANCNLIVSAHGLRKALKAIITSFGKDSDDTLKELFAKIEEARDVIAKAEGK